MWRNSSRDVFVDDEECGQSLLDEDSEDLCSLTPVQRLYGFGGCLIGGVDFMILSLLVFAKPLKFAVLFTFGNVLAVGSTAFLFGPGQQIRLMFDSVRIYATAIYLGCVVLSLICALGIHNKILTVIAMISEICALIWYTLSYIPFARRMVSEMMKRFCDTEL
ncbi:vesicle transport protein SFT2B-like [Cucurbita pepo subsp. pepo]|uniref:vesicle transport protein SFT2B-like n=1 Tax=Cucurbita pepo subsp. pepo TaxID=3664 RepID=UPI000C9D53A3|nr:vesicle transport protein SFT2B-like [Cucurbita pepo subsp. pepo]